MEESSFPRRHQRARIRARKTTEARRAGRSAAIPRRSVYGLETSMGRSIRAGDIAASIPTSCRRGIWCTRVSQLTRRRTICIGSVDAKREQQSSKPLVAGNWQAVIEYSREPMFFDELPIVTKSGRMTILRYIP